MVEKHREKIIGGFDSEIVKLREKVRKGSGKIRSRLICLIHFYKRYDVVPFDQNLKLC